MWRKNFTCSVCKKFAWDKKEHFPTCRFYTGVGEVQEVQEAKEEPEVWKAFHRGGGKWDVSIKKGGNPAEGGDNVSKLDALALVEKLNA